MSTAVAAANEETATLNPNALLDHLITQLGLKNDAALARELDMAAPVISKIRHGRLPIGASFLISAHEVTGLPVYQLREIMGDRRKRFRDAMTDVS